MKTPTLRKYESRLVEVNDQLCYFLFSDIESESHIKKASVNTADAFTTDVFPNNEFSERLHIKVEALPAFREKAFHTLVGMSLIAAAEYLLNYIEDIEVYRSLVLPSPYDSIFNEKPEEQLKDKLKGWHGRDIDIAIIKTVKYLRLRRNHIAHVREEMSDGFSSLVKNDANFLNKYWGSKTTELYDFDFSNREYSTFSVKDVFALVNLTRVCMRLIDEVVVSTVAPKDIAQFEIGEFLENKSLNGMVESKKVRKFKAFIQHKYGVSIECSEEDYNDYVANA
jgi:hypothetical protein